MTERRPRLVGREHELARLRTRVASARIGRGTVSIVQGEAGIGKTRLVDELLAGLDGVRPLVGRADELSVHVPFAPLVDAFGLRRSSHDPRRARLMQLLGSADAGPSGTFGGTRRVPIAIVEALVDLFEALAAEGPCVLVVDDVHWADSASILCLASLARRVGDMPAGIVVTTRPGGGSREGAQLLHVLARLDAETVWLSPLGSRDVVTLAHGLLGVEPGERLVAQLGRLGGNPLFIRELLESAVAEDALREEAGRLDLAAGELPVTFRLLVLGRLATLGPAVVECLRAAAVLGRVFSLEELAGLTGRPAVSLVHPLEQARAAGLLADAGRYLSFRHDLVREAIYEDLPEAVRAALHRAAMGVLDDVEAPAERVVPHALAIGGEEAARWLQRSALGVLTKSPSSAVEMCEAALRMLGSRANAPDRLQLAEALLAAGRVREAEAVASAVGDVDDPAHRARAAVVRFQSLVGASEFAAALDVARDAARRAVAGTPEEAWAHSVWAGLANMVGDVTTGEAAATTALELAERGGYDRTRWTALAFLGWAKHATEGRAVALSLIERAAASAQSADGLPHAYHGLVLLDLDRMDEAKAAFARAVAIHENDGQLHLVGIARAGLVGVHFYRGAWDDAVAEAEGFLDFADEFGVQVGALSSRGVLSAIAAVRGDLDGAAQHIAAAEAVLASSGPQAGMDILWLAQAYAAERRGDDAAALAAYETGWSVATSFRSLGMSPERTYGPAVVRLALRLGRPALAASVTAAVCAAVDDVPGMVAAQRHVSGLLAGVCVDDVAGAANGHGDDVFADAVALYAKSPRLLDRAYGARDAAEAAAHRGDRQAARAFAVEAMAAFDALGAKDDGDRLAAELRRAGIRLGSTARRGRPKSGWASLTPAELRVAELVGQAMTNGDIARRLYVSQHTVETHVRHVYRKLDLATRTELAVAASAHFSRPG